MSVAVIINPISGGRRYGPVAERAKLAASVVERHGAAAAVFVTERPGHARELAKAAAAGGARLVIAWGGDGTINEVASALAFGDVPIAIVPAGSGNGLATELAIDRQPERAIAAALTAAPRPIDLGELDGRLFVNIAGLGLDAYVAAQFNEPGNVRRGLLTYARITGRAMLAYAAGHYRITTDTGPIEATGAVVVSLANGAQYGNNARIAPNARVDDGVLDLIVVEERSRLRTLTHFPKLFQGTADRVPGCTTRKIRMATIESNVPITYHVDGEPVLGGTILEARIHPNALRIAV